MRDHEFERAFAADVEFLARNIERLGFYEPEFDSYVRAVRDRMQVGAERYGDNDFLTKDNLKEALEETPDVMGYALLECQRLRALGFDWQLTNEIRIDLISASVHSAIADRHLRNALRKRDSG